MLTAVLLARPTVFHGSTRRGLGIAFCGSLPREMAAHSDGGRVRAFSTVLVVVMSLEAIGGWSLVPTHTFEDVRSCKHPASTWARLIIPFLFCCTSVGSPKTWRAGMFLLLYVKTVWRLSQVRSRGFASLPWPMTCGSVVPILYFGKPTSRTTCVLRWHEPWPRKSCCVPEARLRERPAAGPAVRGTTPFTNLAQ